MEDNGNIESGVLEVTPKGYGFLRQEKNKFHATPGDVFVGKDFIGGERLRPGLFIEAKVGSPTRRKGGPKLEAMVRINGRPAGDYMDVIPFKDLMVVDPSPHLQLETKCGPLEMRILDLICPVGRGQRGLIVAPPRSGKTILLQQMAHAIAVNHPEVHLIVLLIDERPEELTDFRRKVQGEVVASTNDQDVPSHVHAAEFTIERAKRMVEFGDDVVILLDSLTRMGRAYNRSVESSGRTMTGGMDIRAMETPKRLFGAARKIEDGGSLTILATALVETGSRMDDLIFVEFKGTGNMELVLDRKFAEKRIWPAIDISRTGTRKEELLIESWQLEKLHMLRRYLSQMSVDEELPQLIKAVSKFNSNEQFLKHLNVGS